MTLSLVTVLLLLPVACLWMNLQSAMVTHDLRPHHSHRSSQAVGVLRHNLQEVLPPVMMMMKKAWRTVMQLHMLKLPLQKARRERRVWIRRTRG